MFDEINKIIAENADKLQKGDITEITKHKIKYIKEYVKNWIYINCSNNKCNIINFVDCMCNAGVYSDGTLTTAMEVLDEYITASKKFPSKVFCLFLNDYDDNRIDVIKKIVSIIIKKDHGNIKVFYDDKDVNKYLNELKNKYSEYFTYGSNTVLFVDPYNFGSVKIKYLIDFVNNNYCELIYNYFSSDYRRNIKNDYALSKKEIINNALDGIEDYSSEMNDSEVMNLICNNLKKGVIEYTFSYQFRTIKNVSLYSIIFATRHWRGLEEIKEAYWKIFEGNPFYKNDYEENDSRQLSFFKDNEINEDYYINESKKLIIDNFKNNTMTYSEIQIFLLENTMLKTGQIIKKILVPLINEEKIIKMNLSGARNYRQDNYIIVGESNE